MSSSSGAGGSGAGGGGPCGACGEFARRNCPICKRTSRARAHRRSPPPPPTGIPIPDSSRWPTFPPPYLPSTLDLSGIVRPYGATSWALQQQLSSDRLNYDSSSSKLPRVRAAAARRPASARRGTSRPNGLRPAVLLILQRLFLSEPIEGL
ncbi:uncharacterized protein A4U43_C04F11260 [Asparagus officinalis]|uniref:Uncharacterized protein n=1 Tax=Asparagus officinalis TaxID=4686 RepID=A0A5P1F0H5_ASPOF|nr:uncharacterized protein A4U43_C04F11260 [Asparagus officinalis]